MSVLSASVRCTAIGVAFAAALPVFEDATFVLEPGFYGLVGANGAGKTTLLRVLSGEVSPSEGTLAVQPKSAVVASAAFFAPRPKSAPSFTSSSR